MVKIRNTVCFSFIFPSSCLFVLHAKLDNKLKIFLTETITISVVATYSSQQLTRVTENLHLQPTCWIDIISTSFCLWNSDVTQLKKEVDELVDAIIENFFEPEKNKLQPKAD